MTGRPGATGRRVGWALVPLLLVGVIYAPALLDLGFVWDDKAILQDSARYRADDNWLEAMRRPLAISPNYFRPLVVLTFLIELRTWGSDPTPLHLANLLVHMANTGLVALLVLFFLRAGNGAAGFAARAPAAAILAGLLYGLHPAVTEAVAFITGRFDLLCAFFVLSGLLCDSLFERRRRLRAAACALCFLLAALSKEMAVTFPLVLLLWQVARGRSLRPATASRSDRSRFDELWPVQGAVLIAGLAYLGIRFGALGYLLYPPGDAHLPAGSPLEHALLVALSLIEYVKLAVWPFGTLTPIHYTTLPVPPTSAAAWVSPVLALLLVSGIVVAIRLRRAVGWLSLAAVVSLLPVLNLVPLNLVGGAFVAERYLALPLALAAVASGVLCVTAAGQRWRRPVLAGALVGAAVWLAACTGTIRAVLPHWRGNLELWTWTAATAPRSPVPHANLANAYNDRGDHRAALASARAAVDLDPEAALSWNSLGRSYFLLERLPDALDAFRKATQIEPDRALPWGNVGGVLLAMNRLAEAEAVLRDQALRLDPDNGLAHANLGLVYALQGRSEPAREHLSRAHRLLPPGQREQTDAVLEQLERSGE